MSEYKIMIVDDDKRIVDMIEEYMKLYNIKSIPVYCGKDALAFIDDTIKLVILDINMDDINGIDVCKEIRKKYNIPIILLSANATQYDKVRGLGVGADDYITKPFDPMELAARVKAHIRRTEEYSKNRFRERPIKFDDIVIYRNAHKIIKENETVHLSNTEYKLLLYLLDNSNTALTRKQILYNVWESDIYDESTVTTYIKRLRNKIDYSSNKEKYIKSVRGVGYIFEAEIRY